MFLLLVCWQHDLTTHLASLPPVPMTCIALLFYSCGRLRPRQVYWRSL